DDASTDLDLEDIKKYIKKENHNNIEVKYSINYKVPLSNSPSIRTTSVFPLLPKSCSYPFSRAALYL
ncbi:MAG: hypothetical protein J6Z35_08905, partial [Lachnospiraceae bacterium]|nr:hypothetical protein [Lachnospiraceae bacterium]